MQIRLAIFLGSISFLFPAFAQAKDCAPKGYEELVRCAMDRSADVQILERQWKAASHLEGIARQWHNPEIEVESVYKGSEKSETTAALLFDVRLGGKREAEIQEAQGEVQKAKAGRDLDVSRAKLDLILKLYQLSHLNHQIQIEEESVSTFSKIAGQYRRRAALSPEQEVSLSVFKMAISDHQLNLVKLKAEQEKVLQEVVSSTGFSKETISKNLPGHKTAWPAIPSAGDLEASPHSQFASGELLAAQGQKDKADAAAWPDLKLGPAIKLQKEGEAKDNYFGFAVSMPLPFFSWNGAGRNYGAQKLAEAEIHHALAKRKISGMREQLAKKYEATVLALKAAGSDKAAEDKHERVEHHFFKGLVPSSLVIEAHRQLVDLEEKRNESEREAIEALGSLLILDGKFSEVIL